MKYDVIIIGAGPCGMFTALQLKNKLNVLLLDAGINLKKKQCYVESIGKCRYCKPICNILGGWGGAQFFEGTKLSMYPAGSGLIKFCENIENTKFMYEKVDTILEFYGKEKRLYPEKKKVEKLYREFKKNGIEMKYYNAQKVSKK